MNYEEKIANELSKIRHKCSCGHTVYIPQRNEFVYCDWCFRRVYKDEKTKFKHKLLERLGKTNNEQVSQ